MQMDDGAKLSQQTGDPAAQPAPDLIDDQLIAGEWNKAAILTCRELALRPVHAERRKSLPERQTLVVNLTPGRENRVSQPA